MPTLPPSLIKICPDGQILDLVDEFKAKKLVSYNNFITDSLWTNSILLTVTHSLGSN